MGKKILKVLFVTLILCGVAFAAVNFFTASVSAREANVEWGKLYRAPGNWVCITGRAVDCCIVYG